MIMFKNRIRKSVSNKPGKDPSLLLSEYLPVNVSSMTRKWRRTPCGTRFITTITT